MLEKRLQLVASTDVFRCDDRQWPSCHCATIESRGDTLIAAWYAGAYEKSPDQAILWSRCQAPAWIWQPAVPLVNTPAMADGNPVLWSAPDGRLWLFFVTIVGQGWDQCKLLAQVSPDSYAWRQPQVVREERGWMARARPLSLPDGRTLLPLYDERDWSGHVVDLGRAYDGGPLLRRYGHVTAPQGLIQPVIVPLTDGRLRMYLLTGGPGGFIWQSESADGGRTWTYPEPTCLPNPNSGIDALRLHNGWLVMAYNDSKVARTPLCLAVSEDDGATWQHELCVENGPGEFSYPTLVQDGRANLHLLFTHKRRSIAHRVYRVLD
jgi:predicted neuraminidase